MNEIQKVPRVRVGYSGNLVMILVIVILLLLAFVAYVFLIKPSINGYVVDKQVEAQQILINNIILQVQQQGYVSIDLSNNQTLVLVPYTGTSTPSK